MIALRRAVPRIPGAIIALVAGTAVAMLFGASVDTVGGRFGGIPSGLPVLQVWSVTFALTVFADLTLAVEVGMILAALTFIRRVAITTSVSRVTPDFIDQGRVHTLQGHAIPSYAIVYKIHGPFLFGASDKLQRIPDHIDGLPEGVILRLRYMTAIDGTGLRAIEDLSDRLRASGRTLVLCGARDQPAAVLKQAEFHEHVGHHNICSNIQMALQRAARIHAARAA